MSCLKSKTSSFTSIDVHNVCKVCHKNFETTNLDSTYCDKCMRWMHLNCCGIPEHEFHFYVNNKDPFYYIDCVNELGLSTVGSKDFLQILFSKIFLSR